MDLPPAFNDMITNNINNFSDSAHQKLQEAQNIMQSALDTHMLLSHYDFYKQFSNNIADDLQSFKNDFLDSSDSGGTLNSLTNVFNYGEQQLKNAKNTYSQLMNMKNNVINTAKTKTDEISQQLSQAKNIGSNLLEDTKTKIGDTIKTVKTDVNGKLQNMKSIAEDEANALKIKGQQQLNDSINDSKIQQTNYEDMLKNMKIEDPSDINSFFNSEELQGEVMKTPFLNEYYGSRYNPEEDIFNEINTYQIKGYTAATKKIKGIKKFKNNTKKKMTENEEEQNTKQSQVVEEPNVKPSQAISKLENEGVTMKGDLPTAKKETDEPPIKEEPEQDINRFENETTDDLQARYDMLQNSARSQMAEQDMNDIGEELTNRVILGMDTEKSVAPVAETMLNIENEGDRLLQTVNNTISQPVAQIQENLINQSARTFQNLTEPISDTINDVYSQIKSGVADGISKAKSIISGAAEESIGEDEDPIGLGVTVVLGLADLGTQIASFFEGSPHQPPQEQLSKQIGV